MILGPPAPPKDDETIVKMVVRRIVNIVSRRVPGKNRRRFRSRPKTNVNNNENQPQKPNQDNQDNQEIDASQPNSARDGRGRNAPRSGNGYYPDPSKLLHVIT